MLPYMAITVLLVFSTLFDKTKLETVIFWIFSAVLLAFSAFRIGGTGEGDYYNYLYFYSLITDWKDIFESRVNAEIGFRFFSYLGNMFNFDGQFIIIVMAILSLLPLSILIKKYSYYPIASYVFLMPYFLTMNMHTSRTAVSASFGLVFIHLYYKERKTLAAIFFMAALSFHSSAICLLLILLTRLSYRKLLILLTISFVIGTVLNPLNLIAELFNVMGLSRFAIKVISYQGSSEFGYNINVYDPRIIINFLICLLIYNTRNSVNNEQDIFYFKIYFVGTITLIAFSSLAIVAWRISYYYLISATFVLPSLCKYYNYQIFQSLQAKRMMSAFMLFIYFIYSLPLIIGAEPYEFYF